VGASAAARDPGLVASSLFTGDDAADGATDVAADGATDVAREIALRTLAARLSFSASRSCLFFNSIAAFLECDCTHCGRAPKVSHLHSSCSSTPLTDLHFPVSPETVQLYPGTEQFVALDLDAIFLYIHFRFFF